MKRILTSISGSILLLALNACTSNHAAEKREDKVKVAVRLSTVQSLNASKPVHTSGLTSSETESNLSFKTDGIVLKTYVKTGDFIKKGQLLASLNLTEIEAQVVQAKNALNKAGRDLDRFKELLKKSAATLEQVQNMTTLFENAQETYRIATYNLSNSQIHAAYDGVVLKKWINEGELVRGGHPVFTVSARNVSSWVLIAGLSDKDWARVSIGDTAQIHFDHMASPVQGSIVRLAQGADPQNGTYQVEFRLAVTSESILANGLVGSVELYPSKTRKVKLIPIESIIEGNGKNAFVYVPYNENSVKKLPVEIAYIDDRQVAIASGLELVQQVVSAGSAYLNETSTIMIIK